MERAIANYLQVATKRVSETEGQDVLNQIVVKTRLIYKVDRETT